MNLTFDKKTKSRLNPQDVARRAYDFFIARGREPGRHEEDWSKAEAQLIATGAGPRIFFRLETGSETVWIRRAAVPAVWLQRDGTMRFLDEGGNEFRKLTDQNVGLIRFRGQVDYAASVLFDLPPNPGRFSA
jgi:hypothetical protein